MARSHALHPHGYIRSAGRHVIKRIPGRRVVMSEPEIIAAAISDYARSWTLLLGYDDQTLEPSNHQQTGMVPLDYNEVLQAIAQFKHYLIQKGEASDLFARLRGEGLASAIASIEQGFGDDLFYPNVASRAANLLYFVIKNHPLTDGNKRTGAFLFIWYLRINQHLLAKPVEQLINDNGLVAIALLAAQSQPDQKDVVIRLVEQFILLQDHS
ncbi:MAG: Fic family protein [Ketobacter sp.]|nr:Fic family protein [Ketobacter sp.]